MPLMPPFDGVGRAAAGAPPPPPLPPPPPHPPVPVALADIVIVDQVGTMVVVCDVGMFCGILVVAIVSPGVGVL